MENEHTPKNPFNEHNDPDDAYDDDVSSTETSDYSVEDDRDVMQQHRLQQPQQHQPANSDLSRSNPTETNKDHDSSDFKHNLKEFLEPIPIDFSPLDEGYGTWKISDIGIFDSEKIAGPKFTVGKHVFNLLVLPQRRINGIALSIYLESHPIDEKKNDDGTSAEDWSLPVQFAIDAWNPDDPTKHKKNQSHFRYNNKTTDWGFVTMISTRNDAAIIRQKKLNLTAYVRVIDDYTGVLFHNWAEYDSKSMTGYVGINNQGATCYLNSLLQSYYFTKLFRKKVYQIPTDEELNLNITNFRQYQEQPKSVSLALQRIFYNLQTSEKPIDTMELTQSFGWTGADAFTQHDVQELNRILMDRLETKMKGTEIEGCLNDIFVGKMKSFIRCINVQYESSRIEDFWDIQLNVKALKNIKESFENYIELEVLDGDNKYDASGYGLQDAEKGVVFESFPPVLHLQLKRFEYDFEYDQLVKINDRYEFFDEIDLKPYLDKDAKDYDEDWTYQLHGVLVHQGDVSMGHYYAMIRPTAEDKWFRFDDDKVWRVTPNEVFEGCFGADRLATDPRKLTREEQAEYQMKRVTSAYMLVYMRKSKVEGLLNEPETKDVPPHVVKQITYEHDELERLRKEQEEMHLYANFKIYTGQTFSKYEGFDIGPDEGDKHNFAEDLFDPQSFPITFRLLKTDPFIKVFEKVSEILGKNSGNPEHFRFWNMTQRKNHTDRPVSPVPFKYGDENYNDVTIEDIIKQSELYPTPRRRLSRGVHLNLFLEDAGKDLKYLSNGVYSLRNKKGIPEKVEKVDDFGEKLQKFSELVAVEQPAKISSVEEGSKILLFVKFFDLEKQSLKGVGHIVVTTDNSIDYLTQLLNNLLGIPIETPLKYYEELTRSQVSPLNNAQSFYKSELISGDILIFTKAKWGGKESNKKEFKSVEDIASFLDYRVHFRISPLIKAEEDEEEFVVAEDGKDEKDTDVDQQMEVRENSKASSTFEIWFSMYGDHKQLTKKIGEHIGVDPEFIRLFVITITNKCALRKDQNFRKLLDRVPKSQTIDIQYEVLNVTLSQLEDMVHCKVSWVGQGICREQRHEFAVPKASTIDQLIDRLQNKVHIKPEDRDSLICWSFDYNNRQPSICPLDSLIEMPMQLVIGNYPNFKEILESGSDNIKLVPGFQFFGNIQNSHSIPFIFDLVDGEAFKDTKVRLHKLLGMSEKEFNSIRVIVTDMKTVEYLDDDRQNLQLYAALKNNDNAYIGIDHPNRNTRKGSGNEPSIFIRA